MKSKIVSIIVIATQMNALYAFASPTGPGQPGGGGHGPGPGPGPQPSHGPSSPPVQPPQTPSPTPVPVTPTTPSPTPVPVDTTAAKNAGNADGTAAGQREGNERGPRDGSAAGQNDGYSTGFNRCQERAEHRAHDDGFSEGYREGQNEGNIAGTNSGQTDGSNAGTAAGRTDGQTRADNDARTAGTQAGTQQGTADADAQIATIQAQANSDGTTAGDQAALAQAKSVDYPRGRADYNATQLATQPQTTTSFSQRPAAPQIAAAAPAAKPSLLTSMLQSFGLIAKPASQARPNDAGGQPSHGGGGNQPPHDDGDVQPNPQPQSQPDFRYLNPTRTFSTPEETSAYNSAYRSAYSQGFQSAYNQSYTQSYDPVFMSAQDNGCDQANRGDYREQHEQGEHEGRDKGYADAFAQSRQIAYNSAYNTAFSFATQQSYSASYPADYQAYFTSARSSAATAEQQAIYQAAYNAAKTNKYNQAYPVYAQQQYQLGQNDEAADFASRPVRITSAQITGTLPDGLLEPVETMHIQLNLRNYAASALAGKDVQVTIQAVSANGAVLSVPSETLVQDLQPASLTTVNDALVLSFDESAVGQAQSLLVHVTYQGRDGGSQTVQVTPQFMTGISLVSGISLEEGIQSDLSVQVTNNSQVTTDPATQVTLVADASQLTVLQPSIALGALAPGQTVTLKFPVVALGAAGQMDDIRLSVSVTLPSGRRVGLLTATDEVPIINDYDISLRSDLTSLRQTGVTRVGYTITNVSSRMIFKSLQLKVTVQGPNASNFQVIGPNPQYLVPLAQGASLNFFVPVLAASANTGGTLQIEVQEAGRTVIVHKAQF